eukprot:UN28676
MIVTVSTVGYGDISPETPEGKFVMSCVIFGAMTIIPWQAAKLSFDLLARNRLVEDKKLGIDPVRCQRCGSDHHSSDATHCYKCGRVLTKPKDKSKLNDGVSLTRKESEQPKNLVGKFRSAEQNYKTKEDDIT